MGRTPNWAYNHALLIRKLDDKRSSGGKHLAKKKEWPLLTDEQQRFLSFYAAYGDAKLAAVKADVDLVWVHQQEQDENFAFVMRNVTEKPKKMAEKIALNALPLSMYILRQMIEEVPSDLADKKFRLDAIRHLHKVTGTQQTPDIGNTQNTQINFDMHGLSWGADPSIPAEKPESYLLDDEAIEAEGRLVDDY